LHYPPEWSEATDTPFTANRPSFASWQVNIIAHLNTVKGGWVSHHDRPDKLNRLTLAAPADNAPSSYIHAVACFGYDGFGNRTKAAFDTASSDCFATAGTTIASYTATNQVSFVSQSSPISYSAPTGFIYDGAGNVYQDGKNTYAYDGEGRLCAVTLTAGGTQYQYLYDAEGLRVGQATFTGAFPAKNAVCAAPGAATGFALTKQYLLDQGGDQVTELTGTGVWKHSNVWAGSHLQATYDTVGLHYYLADPLGTKRVQANITGQTEETCQSLPFGDNLSCSQTALATADDATEHHFTGKERDSESGNDYFGARYYSSPVGRFLSPDWSAKEEPVPYAKLDDPQTLNLYGYVGNNPLSRVDANGHGYLLEKFEEIFYAKVSVGPGVGAELKLTKYLGVKAEARAGFEVKKTAKEETGSLKAEATLKVKAGPFEAGKKASAEMQVEKDGKLDVKKPTVQCCELSAGSGPLEASKNEIGVGGHYGAFGGEVGADVDKAKEFLAAVKDRVANASQEFMKKLLK
jgi:RHS repeat-associated protein